MSKKQSNPILEEVWAARDAYAKKFNYDLEAMIKDQKRLAQELRQQGYTVATPSQKEELKPIQSTQGK